VTEQQTLEAIEKHLATIAERHADWHAAGAVNRNPVVTADEYRTRMLRYTVWIASTLTTMLVLSVVGTVLVLVAADAEAAPRAACMKIRAINYDPAGADDATNAHLNRETVTLRNGCASSVTITGWTLRDAQSNVYTFPTTTVGASSTVVVHTGRGTNRQGHRYWQRRQYVWNNEGDTARLRRATGVLVATYTY
jgi:hypothetical protein